MVVESAAAVVAVVSSYQYFRNYKVQEARTVYYKIIHVIARNKNIAIIFLGIL